MQRLSNFIDGEFIATVQYLDSFDPSSGRVYCHVPDSDSSHVDMAVKAAKAAFPAWSSLSRHKRSQYLNRVADLLESRIDEFAQAESKDQGKPRQLAASLDIPRAVYNFRYFAGKILYMQEKKTDLDGVAMNYTQRVPLGVAGLISPWNLYWFQHVFDLFLDLCIF